MTLYFIYYYKGANCSSIEVKRDKNDQIQLLNDYNEVMFTGYDDAAVDFLKELKDDKFA